MIRGEKAGAVFTKVLPPGWFLSGCLRLRKSSSITCVMEADDPPNTELGLLDDMSDSDDNATLQWFQEQARAKETTLELRLSNKDSRNKM